ncbi:MAG: hypothetical protein LBH00_05375, partial [Planctomycetaceae bacterium]|nr:hypothetical protein [Planctomycetaceae bacterium]
MRNTLDSPYRKYFLTLMLIMLVRGITLGQLFTIDDVAAQDKEIVERYIKDVQTLEPVSLEIAKKIQNRTAYNENQDARDKMLNHLEIHQGKLQGISSYLKGMVCTDAVAVRTVCTKQWLTYRQLLSQSFDSKHDFNKLPQMNLSPYEPENLPKGYVPMEGFYVSGMDPLGITDPLVRKDYEKRIAENRQLSRERIVQSTVKYLL